MPQAVTDPFHSEAWLESPIRLQNDELQLAGALRDVPGLDPQSMRVLGSYSFIYMVNVDGYYADANGHTCDLSSGDLVLIFPELAPCLRSETWHELGSALLGLQWPPV